MVIKLVPHHQYSHSVSHSLLGNLDSALQPTAEHAFAPPPSQDLGLENHLLHPQGIHSSLRFLRVAGHVELLHVDAVFLHQLLTLVLMHVQVSHRNGSATLKDSSIARNSLEGPSVPHLYLFQRTFGRRVVFLCCNAVLIVFLAFLRQAIALELTLQDACALVVILPNSHATPPTQEELEKGEKKKRERKLN